MLTDGRKNTFYIVDSLKILRTAQCEFLNGFWCIGAYYLDDRGELDEDDHVISVAPKRNCYIRLFCSSKAAKWPLSYYGLELIYLSI